MALEALSEYELAKTTDSIIDVTAEFTTSEKNDIIELQLTNVKEKVETELQVISSHINEKGTHLSQVIFVLFIFPFRNLVGKTLQSC